MAILKDKDLICENLTIDCNDNLQFANVNVSDMAKKYGTPLYLFDENRIRKNVNVYKKALSKNFGDKGITLYASKAFSCKRIYEIMKEEGSFIDVVSCGEIATAKKAGFNLEHAFFHSNNKTDEDIVYAITNGVGVFVVDTKEELIAIDQIANKLGKIQNVLLRLTPGIDPHTYEAVATGKIDSKFGFSIDTGAAEEITAFAITLKNVNLLGFHCHVGSQVFDSDVYMQTADIMVGFMNFVKEKYGFTTKVLDLGGGYGVRYTKDDPTIDIAANIDQVSNKLKSLFAKFNLETPCVCLEPGRSIVADAGLTVYTVGSVKEIKGYKTYVSVDGGMTDNPRYALYGSKYTVLPAKNFSKDRDMLCTIAGRCCESGDIIQENVLMPKDIKRGDYVCVLTTGAYNYSMASNYNRLPRPAVVMIKDKTPYIAVKRETFDDITRLDV